jgi:phage I-like protein
MNPPILNREFKHPADGWYHIEPAGRHYNAGLDATQVIDAAAISAIVGAFNREAAAADFPGLLIDHEHFKHDARQESRAYGWLMKLQGRADGIYGRVNWTGTGKPAVNHGDYRFFSTEYDRRDLENISETEKRPLKLAGLTLTNDPNNKGARPITNRREETPAQKDKQMRKIAEQLGLSPEATEDEIVAAARALQDEVTALKGAADRVDDAVVNREVAALGVADEDEKAELTVIIKNSADREKTLKVLKNRFAAKPQTVAKPVTNREQARTPVAGAAVKNKAAAQNALVTTIKNSRRCSFEDAWELAKAEKPDLFAEEEKE